MECSDARTAISARLDGEASELDHERSRAPTSRSCADCRSFTADAEAAHRRLRMHAAEPVPDLTPQIFAAIDAETQDVQDVQDARVGGLRAGLAAVAMIQILIALPALLLGEDAGLARAHGSSPRIVLGCVGHRVPGRGVASRTGRWFAAPDGCARACLLLTSGLDVAASRADALSELGGHATELVGLGLLFLLARETGVGHFCWERRAHNGRTGGPAHS